MGLHGRHRRRARSAPCSSSSASRRRDEEQQLLAALPRRGSGRRRRRTSAPSLVNARHVRARLTLLRGPAARTVSTVTTRSPAGPAPPLIDGLADGRVAAAPCVKPPSRPHAAVLHRPPQRPVVALVLVGVRLGERAMRAVEGVAACRGSAAIAIASPERACARASVQPQSSPYAAMPVGSISSTIAEPFESQSWRT